MTNNNQIIMAASCGLFKYLYMDGHQYKKEEFKINQSANNEDDKIAQTEYKNIFNKFIDRIDNDIEKEASSNEALVEWIANLKNILSEATVDWKLFLADFNYLSTSVNIKEARNIFHNEIYQIKTEGTNPFFNVLVCDDLFLYSLQLYGIIERIFDNYGITNPIIHFDFEYDPENVENRCREKKYDLILLDIDFSVLEKGEKPARKIAKWAHNQDPAIPIIISSKYADVEYYKDLLSNVIYVMPKGKIRDKINSLNEDMKIEDIVLKDFLYPIIRELVIYYKLVVFNYRKQTIFQFRPGSTINKSGIYDRINYSVDITEIPNDMNKINDIVLKEILIDKYSDDKNSIYNYLLIPRMNLEGKLSLLFIVVLPDILNPSLRLVIEQRLKNYGYYSTDYSPTTPKTIEFSLDDNKFQYELFEFDFREELSLGTKWEGLEPTNLATCLMKDLEYLVIPKLNKMSLLDIIGPIMIGPSSSHTAGANRIGRIARNFGVSLLKKKYALQKIEVYMLNSFDTTGNGHGSNKAITAGLLGLPQYSNVISEILQNPSRSNEPDTNLVKDKISLKNIECEELDDKKGHIKILGNHIKIRFNWYNTIEPDLHNNSIRFVYKLQKDEALSVPIEFVLEAQSWGGGNIQVSSIRKRCGNKEEIIKVKINDSFESFYFSPKKLETMRHLLNGKEKIVLEEDSLTIDEIFKDSSLEVIEAILQFDNKYKEKNLVLSGFNTQKITKPNFIGLDDLQEVGENSWLWEIALKYEMWYDYKSTPDKIYQIFSNYVVLMLMLAEKHSSNTSSTDDFDRNDAFNLLPDDEKEEDNATMAMIYAIGVNEANAKFGLVLAAPTAGSCGVIPGVLKVMDEFLLKTKNYKNEYDRYKLLTEGLLISALVGLVITNVVPPAGASHGCQAEIGTAGAMASSLCAYIHCRVNGKKKSETAKMVIHAAAIALKTSLGLVCDPLGGKVEDPCIKRSGLKASEAIQIGKAVSKGLESKVSPSNVVSAMKEIGENMLGIYKETSKGGLASTLISRTIK